MLDTSIAHLSQRELHMPSRLNFLHIKVHIIDFLLPLKEAEYTKYLEIIYNWFK